MPNIILESIHGIWSVKTNLPTGKLLEYKFLEKTKGDGHFICEVPTEIRYVDDFKNEKVFHRNYAQHLVDSYPDNVRIVSVREEPTVVEPVIVPAKGKGEKKREKVPV
jgi:hypothetical protein